MHFTIVKRVRRTRTKCWVFPTITSSQYTIESRVGGVQAGYVV